MANLLLGDDLSGLRGDLPGSESFFSGLQFASKAREIQFQRPELQFHGREYTFLRGEGVFKRGELEFSQVFHDLRAEILLTPASRSHETEATGEISGGPGGVPAD